MDSDRIIAANFVGFILMIFGRTFYAIGESALSIGFYIPSGLCFIVAIILTIQHFRK